MVWGPVTNIGSTVDQTGLAFITITPSAAISPGTLIVCGAVDSGQVAIGSTQLTDSAGNAYTLVFSTNSSDTVTSMAVWFSTNAQGLSTSQLVKYTKTSPAQSAAMSGVSVVNSQGFKFDSGVTKTNSAVNNATPTVTSNAPIDGGELFFGFAGEDSITASFSQAAGWSFPPNDAAGTLIDIMGGNKVAPTAVAQTFAPGSTGTPTWVAGIFGFRDNGMLLSYYEPLPEPVRTPPVYYWSYERNFENVTYSPVIGVNLTDIFPALSDPIRRAPSLPAGASPFMAMQINYVQYRFSLVEAFDKPTITINAFAPLNAAQVTITEIQSQTTQVTIQEVKFTRGYS